MAPIQKVQVMALVTRVNRTANSRSVAVANALSQIITGIGVLETYDGQRNESISVSATQFGTDFGVYVEPQAFNDRWQAFLAAYQDPANAEYAKLRDLINATFVDETATP